MHRLSYQKNFIIIFLYSFNHEINVACIHSEIAQITLNVCAHYLAKIEKHLDSYKVNARDVPDSNF